MNRETALFVKKHRLGLEGECPKTQRRIAEVVDGEWPGNGCPNGNQLVGMDLIHEAIEVLGESATDWDDAIDKWWEG